MQTHRNRAGALVASWVIAGCRATSKTIELPKKSPPSIHSIVTKPITADGIANSTSGTVTTLGDSCGSP